MTEGFLCFILSTVTLDEYEWSAVGSLRLVEDLEGIFVGDDLPECEDLADGLVLEVDVDDGFDARTDERVDSKSEGSGFDELGCFSV